MPSGGNEYPSLSRWAPGHDRVLGCGRGRWRPWCVRCKMRRLLDAASLGRWRAGPRAQLQGPGDTRKEDPRGLCSPAALHPALSSSRLPGRCLLFCEPRQLLNPSRRACLYPSPLFATCSCVLGSGQSVLVFQFIYSLFGTI